MWHGKRKSSNLVEHGKELRKTNPLYSEDFIMENGVQLTLRTYKLNSTIKIEGFDNNYKICTGDILYLLDNKLHRINGPALIRKYEFYIWAKNGKPHRDDDMPAIESEDNSFQIYYKDGYIHRLEGPAWIENNKKEWWIDGVHMKTEEYWLNETRRIKLDDLLSICRLCG